MGFETLLVGKTQHFVVYARGIADAQHTQSAVDKLLTDPVDRRIALRTDKYLRLAAQYLIDGLDQRRGFASAWRTVDNGHVFGTENLIDGPLLGGVEPR